MPKNIAVLLSGRGSNFKAISDAVEKGSINARIQLVVSNRGNAPGLNLASKRGYQTSFVPSAGKDREAFDREVVEQLRVRDVEIVCLAGFMRLLSPWFVQQYPNKILNIHPSLLPSFPGLNAQKQALEWGVKVTGCTVHFIDEKLDHGPILLQKVVPVEENDTEKSLSDRILVQEHQIYPLALSLVCKDRVRIQNRSVHIAPTSPDPADID